MNERKSKKEKISGNVWFSSCMIGLYVWIIMMYFVITHSDEKLFKGGFMLAIGMLFFMSYSLQMYYFIFNDEYITIKNYFIPWEFEDVNYDDIAELRIDKSYKLPYHLTIVKSDGLTDAYPADTLSTKHWLRLSQIVAEKGIKLIDNASVLH